MAYSSSSKTRSYDLSHGDTRRSVTMTQAADPASTLWRAHGSDGHDASIHLTSQYIRLLSPIHSLLSVSMSYSLLQGRPLNPEKSPPNIPETGRGGGRDIALFVTIFAVVLHCQKIEQKALCCLQISKVTKSYCRCAAARRSPPSHQSHLTLTFSCAVGAISFISAPQTPI